MINSLRGPVVKNGTMLVPGGEGIHGTCAKEGIVSSEIRTYSCRCCPDDRYQDDGVRGVKGVNLKASLSVQIPAAEDVVRGGDQTLVHAVRWTYQMYSPNTCQVIGHFLREIGIR
jgi:hypothetical protein